MDKIGKYKIIEEIGKGAMGIVYKAQDPDIGRDVAIKTIRFDTMSDETDKDELMRRFVREAQAVGKLEHPNIVTIYDVGKEADLTYIVMQFIDGESLKNIITGDRKYSAEEVVGLTNRLCQALDYAHKKGVVHRDVKPANILIDKNGVPYLVDFGVALVEMSTMTSSGGIVGTPSYMAPEQVMGKKVSTQADIFSLGVILYELLTGRRPFEGDHITTVVYKIINETPPLISEINKEIPKKFEPVLKKALAKDVAERYQTCRELAADLAEETQIFDKTITTFGWDKPLHMDDGKQKSGKKPGWFWAATIIFTLAAGAVAAFYSFPGLREKIFPETNAVTVLGLTPIPDALDIADVFDPFAAKLADIKTKFDNKEYPEVIRLAGEILQQDPNNAAAKQFSDRAAAGSIDRGAIARDLAAGKNAFQKGDYALTRQLMNRVLSSDRSNQEAKTYRDLAVFGTASVPEIKTLIASQRRAVEEKELPLLLSAYGTAAVKQRIRTEIEDLFNNYDDILYVIPPVDINVSINEDRTAVAVFSVMISATHKVEGNKKILFEGNITWNLEKQENSWKILDYK